MCCRLWLLRKSSYEGYIYIGQFDVYAWRQIYTYIDVFSNRENIERCRCLVAPRRAPLTSPQPPPTGMALSAFTVSLDIIAALLDIISQGLGYSLQNCIIRTWEDIPQARLSLCKGRKLIKSEMRDSRWEIWEGFSLFIPCNTIRSYL